MTEGSKEKLLEEVELLLLEQVISDTISGKVEVIGI